MSLVTMNRESFYTLGDEKLGSACMEPTFMQIRGMDLERDDELMQMVKFLFDRFEQVVPMTHSIIAKYIRSHSEEFVLLHLTDTSFS